MSDERVTGKEMCETIVKADFLRNEDGTALTAEEIWNSDPHGELWHVFALYEIAKEFLAFKFPPHPKDTP